MVYSPSGHNRSPEFHPNFPNGWQGSNCLKYHLLPSRACISKSWNWMQRWDLNPGRNGKLISCAITLATYNFVMVELWAKEKKCSSSFWLPNWLLEALYVFMLPHDPKNTHFPSSPTARPCRGLCPLSNPDPFSSMSLTSSCLAFVLGCWVTTDVIL